MTNTNEITGKLGTVCIITSGLKIDSKGDRTYPALPQFKIGSPIKRTLLGVQGYDKLVSAVKSNLKGLYNSLIWIGDQPAAMRLYRISSNLLPRFDDPECSHLYDDKLLFIIDHLLARCKKVIDDKQIRIATHPDKKAAVLNSEKENVRLNAVRCLEYHCYFMSRLQPHNNGAVINIHINGRLDHFPEFDQLSDTCKNYLSLENDEIASAGLLPTLLMCEKYSLKMVYDIHHDHAEQCTEGTLDFNSSIFGRILDTWGNVRPLMHISDSRDPLACTPKTISPHSEYIKSDWVQKKAADLLYIADIEVEAKGKQLAVKSLYDDIQKYLY